MSPMVVICRAGPAPGHLFEDRLVKWSIGVDSGDGHWWIQLRRGNLVDIQPCSSPADPYRTWNFLFPIYAAFIREVDTELTMAQSLLLNSFICCDIVWFQALTCSFLLKWFFYFWFGFRPLTTNFLNFVWRRRCWLSAVNVLRPLRVSKSFTIISFLLSHVLFFI